MGTIIIQTPTGASIMKKAKAISGNRLTSNQWTKSTTVYESTSRPE